MTSSDSGIATSEIAVVRTLSRKANSTISTASAASTITRSTLPIARSMKSACLNSTLFTCTPAGSDRPSSDSACSTCAVSLTVSTCGCFSTERITAGSPP